MRDRYPVLERIARRRRELGLRQTQVEERAEIGQKYLFVIKRGFSIPSTEVIMRHAAALETTPDEFLIGSKRRESASDALFHEKTTRPYSCGQVVFRAILLLVLASTSPVS